MDRQKVLDVLKTILREVDYATKKWENNPDRAKKDKDKSIEFWIAHMENYLLSARQKCYGTDKTEALHDLRKMAGLLIRCFLHIGIPTRAEEELQKKIAKEIEKEQEEVPPYIPYVPVPYPYTPDPWTPPYDIGDPYPPWPTITWCDTNTNDY